MSCVSSAISLGKEGGRRIKCIKGIPLRTRFIQAKFWCIGRTFKVLTGRHSPDLREAVSTVCSELVDTLNTYAPNRIKHLNLGSRYPSPPTWDAHILTKLPSSLRSLVFYSDSMHFETGILTALTALTSIKACCNPILLHKHCFPSSLRSLEVDAGNNDFLILEGLQNLRTLKLTSLVIKGAGGSRTPELNSGWEKYVGVWELETLQTLKLFSSDIDSGLNWPSEVSRRTAFTKLKLGFLMDYDASEASISNLRNLQVFDLACGTSESEGVSSGLFDLPLLDTLTLQGEGGYDMRNSPLIWQIETLAVGIQFFFSYDFSQPLLSEPRLKHLTIDAGSLKADEFRHEDLANFAEQTRLVKFYTSRLVEVFSSLAKL